MLPYRPGSLKAYGQGEGFFPQELTPEVRVDNLILGTTTYWGVVAHIPLYKLFGSYISITWDVNPPLRGTIRIPAVGIEYAFSDNTSRAILQGAGLDQSFSLTSSYGSDRVYVFWVWGNPLMRLSRAYTAYKEAYEAKKETWLVKEKLFYYQLALYHAMKYGFVSTWSDLDDVSFLEEVRPSKPGIQWERIGKAGRLTAAYGTWARSQSQGPSPRVRPTQTWRGPLSPSMRFGSPFSSRQHSICSTRTQATLPRTRCWRP